MAANFSSPDWSALAISLNRLRVTFRSAGHQDDAWAQQSGQCYFFFCFQESSSTCCVVFRCGGTFLSFLVDWSSFPTPTNRKMWLLEPICSRRGVVSRLRLVHFLVFLNGQRLDRCVSACMAKRVECRYCTRLDTIIYVLLGCSTFVEKVWKQGHATPEYSDHHCDQLRTKADNNGIHRAKCSTRAAKTTESSLCGKKRTCRILSPSMLLSETQFFFLPVSRLLHLSAQAVMARHHVQALFMKSGQNFKKLGAINMIL